MTDGILILIDILIPISSLIIAFAWYAEIPFHKIITKKEEKSIVDLFNGYGYRCYQIQHYTLFFFRKVFTINMFFQNESDNINIEIVVKKNINLEFRILKTYNPPKNHVCARAETIKTLRKMKKFCESGIEGHFDFLDKNEELQQKLKKIENDF